MYITQTTASQKYVYIRRNEPNGKPSSHNKHILVVSKIVSVGISKRAPAYSERVQTK